MFRNFDHEVITKVVKIFIDTVPILVTFIKSKNVVVSTKRDTPLVETTVIPIVTVKISKSRLISLRNRKGICTRSKKHTPLRIHCY